VRCWSWTARAVVPGFERQDCSARQTVSALKEAHHLVLNRARRSAVVAGESGCGKSTGQVIVGACRPTEEPCAKTADSRWEMKPGERARDLRLNVGMIFRIRRPRF